VTRRLLRSIYCFLAMVMVYWAYAAVMVPLLEPTVVRKKPRDFLANPLDHTSRSKAFERLFAEDAWERQNAKVLETEHGALLFRDYLPQPDGTMELKPVTLVYYSSDRGSGPESLPILIQAPQGAVLQSDRPINLARADFGKPVGARLLGQIIIRRPATSPDHDDELFVTTRNVKIDRQRIWTPNDVEFRFGPHWGRGRDLQITLDSGDSHGPSDSPSAVRPGGMAAGVHSLELMQIDKILISPDAHSLAGPAAATPSATSQTGGAASRGAASRETARQRQVPIEVRCRGVFRFDFRQSIASLTEDVRMLQRYPGGITDSVRCELLELHFASTNASADSSESTSKTPPNKSPSHTESSSRLTLSRVLAQGAPVTLDAPTRQAFAQAEQVEMFFGEQRLVLEGASDARIRLGQRTVRAPRIEYRFHPEDSKKLGQVEADGPGRFEGQVSDQDSRRFRATWQETLRLRPLEDRQVLSLYGTPEIELQGMGSLGARQLHMFLYEETPPPVQTSSTVSTSSFATLPTLSARRETDLEPIRPKLKPGRTQEDSSREVADELFAWKPDRLVAIDDVRLHTEQIRGQALRELKVWFVEPEREPVVGPEPQQRAAAQPAPPNLSPAIYRIPASSSLPIRADSDPLAREKVDSHTSRFTSGLAESSPLEEGNEPDPKVPNIPLQFAGERVEARVVLGESPQLTDLTVAGNVEITRPSEKPDTPPLRIAGELLQISEFGAGDAFIEVRGKPAEAGAEGLILRGSQIFCQQATNQLWIPGPGQMLTPSTMCQVGSSQVGSSQVGPGQRGETSRSTASSGPAGSAPPLTIDWKGRMQFDGLLASFLDGVHVHGQQAGKGGETSQFGIRGSELQVELTRRVNFSEPGAEDESEIGIRLLRFPGQVLMENQTRQPDGQPASWEEMEVTHLRVDPIRGRLEADGPGWLSSVRVSGNSGPGSAFPAGAPQKGSGLAHIRVGFQRAVVGNLNTREIELFEHVLTTYGPVDDWHDRIDPLRGPLAEGGVEMRSDRLRLTEMRSPSAKAQSHYEIQAVGNVEVRGERFQASGYRLSYDDSKDLLILQGNGREYAVVKTPETNGVHEVKELRVWPKSKKIQSDVRSIDLGPVGSRGR
jgi:lipopolysaccharide export system protein LptA